MASPMASWIASPMATLTLTLAPTMSLPIRPGAPPRAARPAVVQPNPLRAARRRLECSGDAPSPLPKRLSGEEQSRTEWSLPLPFPPTCPLAALASPPPLARPGGGPCTPPPPHATPDTQYFVKRTGEREGTAPIVVQNNWIGGAENKRHRFREAQLWNQDPPSYYQGAPVTLRSWPTVLRACARYTTVMADCAASK
jgi:hypothetical protein